MKKSEQDPDYENPATGGFKVFSIPEPGPKVPVEQTPGGFKVFGQAPTSHSEPQSLTSRLPNLTSPNSGARQGATTVQVISTAARSINHWFIRNKKGVTIGGISIVGIIGIALAIKFILALDLSTPKAANTENPNTNTPKKEAVQPSPRNTLPVAPAPRASTTAAAASESDIEPASGYGFVRTPSGSKLNLYAKPSENAAVTKSIANGSFIHILGYTTDKGGGESVRWCKISHVGTEGWVLEKFIEKR